MGGLDPMNITVVLMISAALLASIAGVIPERQFHGFSRYEKFTAVYVIFLVAWPLMWSYMIGPLVWSQVNGAGHLYPSFWYVPALALGVAYFARTVLLPQSRIDLAALLQFSLLGISVVAQALTLNELVHVISAAVLLLPTLVKPARIRMEVIAWGCRISVILVIASVLLSVLVNSAETVEPCRTDKCSIAGHTITSIFSGNGNVLGLSLALLMPFAVYRQSFYRAASMVLAIGLTAELAGSRTAEAGIAFATVLLLAVWAWPALRRPILITGLAGALVVSLIPAVIPFSEEQFTFRPALWNEARGLIGQNPILGSGPFAWDSFGQSSIQASNYSPHNGWLDTVLSIGLSGLIIMVIAVALKVYFSRPDEADLLLLYFATLLVLSTLESGYVPYNLGNIPFSCVLPFLFGAGTRMSNDDVGEDTAEQADDLSPTRAKGRNAWRS
jgi:exopolysaccharide production protein ExoQ